MTGGTSEGVMDAIGFDFEAPVWWDPKARDAIYRPQTFVPCVLVLGEDALLLGHVDGVEARLETATVTTSWPSFSDLPLCDVHAGGTTYRLWFCSPHPRAPRFEVATVAAIDAVLGEHAPGGHLEASRLTAPRLPAWQHLHIGKKRMERLAELLAAP